MVAEELDGVRHVTECLFSALSSRNAVAAAACYDERAVFSSPIIGEVRGADIESLWHAIFAATRDNALSYAVVDLGLTSARVEGVTTYSLVSSGRSVTSRFNSLLHVRDHRVCRHDDTLDPWAWARMAFGPTGFVFGWSRAWQRHISQDLCTSFDTDPPDGS